MSANIASERRWLAAASAAGPTGSAGAAGATGPAGPPGPQGPLLASEGATNAVPLNIYSYFMATTGTGSFSFGQVIVQATGVSGQFCLRSIGPGTFTYVADVNGTRTTGTAATTCDAGNTFTVGASGDFRLQSRRALIHGVHSGDGAAATSYNLYGFSQL